MPTKSLQSVDETCRNSTATLWPQVSSTGSGTRRRRRRDKRRRSLRRVIRVCRTAPHDPLSLGRSAMANVMGLMSSFSQVLDGYYPYSCPPNLLFPILPPNTFPLFLFPQLMFRLSLPTCPPLFCRRCLGEQDLGGLEKGCEEGEMWF